MGTLEIILLVPNCLLLTTYYLVSALSSDFIKFFPLCLRKFWISVNVKQSLEIIE